MTLSWSVSRPDTSNSTPRLLASPIVRLNGVPGITVATFSLVRSKNANVELTVPPKNSVLMPASHCLAV